MRIYGVLACLGGHVSATVPSAPCITPKTVIPAADLVLIGHVAAAAGTFSWSSSGFMWGMEIADFDDHPIYAVLITATNAAGSSRSVLVASSEVCWECAY
jgi:hypothetical protein